MSTSTRYSPEVRERAVRLVFEHEGEYDLQWATLGPGKYPSLPAIVSEQVVASSG